MTTTITARMTQIADDLRKDGYYTAANSVDAIAGERDKFRNGIDNILAALKAAPGLPIECLSREDQGKWTDTITDILKALGPHEVTGKPVTLMEYVLEP